MDCKFKPIHYADSLRNTQIHTTEPKVADTLKGLINNVQTHIYHKEALKKSKDYLNNNIMKVEVDSIKQVYQ